MRLLSVFLFFALLLPAFAAAAQNLEPENDPLRLLRPPGEELEPGFRIDESQPVGPQVSAAYLEDCLKTEHPAYSKENQKLFCSCKADKIPEELSEAEMRVVFEDSIPGQAARDKITAFIAPPCAVKPTYNLAYARCIRNETMKNELDNYRQVCHCISTGLGRFVEDIAAKNSLSSFQRQPAGGDITAVLIDSYGYNRQYEYYQKRCLYTLDPGDP